MENEDLPSEDELANQRYIENLADNTQISFYKRKCCYCRKYFIPKKLQLACNPCRAKYDKKYRRGENVSQN